MSKVICVGNGDCCRACCWIGHHFGNDDTRWGGNILAGQPFQLKDRRNGINQGIPIVQDSGVIEGEGWIDIELAFTIRTIVDQGGNC